MTKHFKCNIPVNDCLHTFGGSFHTLQLNAQKVSKVLKKNGRLQDKSKILLNPTKILKMLLPLFIFPWCLNLVTYMSVEIPTDWKMPHSKT